MVKRTSQGLMILCLMVALGKVVPASNNSSLEVDPFGYPLRTVSPTELRRMLSTGQYQKLNEILQDYQDGVAGDIRREYEVVDAYEALAVADPSYEKLLGDWIRATPRAYQPYLARAFYYYNMGWESRGYKWAKDTNPQQFQLMENYFNQALSDLEFVLKTYPRSLVLYDLLIGMSMALGERETMDWACRKALAIYPHSFLIRADYIHALKPRWLGSYREMEAFAAEAQKYIAANPRLAVLKGYVLADQANLSRVDGDLENALKLYRQALEYGEHSYWYYEVAVTYYKLGRDDQAMAAINKALSLRPQDAAYLSFRGLLYYRKGLIERALLDIESARELATKKSEYRSNANEIAYKLLLKGYEYHKAKEYDRAIAEYDLAARFDPEYGELYYWRARVYVDRNDLGRALADLETAVRLAPTHFDSYLLLDWILARERRWDTIIAYWTRFIELQPDNARAYLERGGAYYHKGDLEAALRDAKKACELGDEEGCRQYQKLLSQIGAGQS
ncbi:MAG: tetratricopeptide repeat protein [Firmicutes bacterium]|nr:tetratricopeptide repeat protein [Bacillota bacterium]